MQDQEYDRRIAVLASALPDVAMANAILRAGFDMVRTELALKHKEALADWQYDLTLACDAAEVDDSADGARRLGYKLGHSRSFDAAHRRLQALQKDRRSDEAAMETPIESVATDEPIVTITEDAAGPVTEADTLGVAEAQSGLITNDPIRVPTAAGEPLSAPGTIDPIGADPYAPEEVPAGTACDEPDGDAPAEEYWPAVPVSVPRLADSPLNEEPRQPADSLARVVDPWHRELKEWPAAPEPEPVQELPDQDAALADPLRRYLEMFDGLQPPPDSS
jgi:hypothetical protein